MREDYPVRKTTLDRQGSERDRNMTLSTRRFAEPHDERVQSKAGRSVRAIHTGREDAVEPE